MKLKLQNYNIIRDSGYVSLDDIDTAYELEERWVKSERLVLVTFFTLIILTIAASFFVFTADSQTPQSALAANSIGILVGSLLACAAYRYYMYIQVAHGVRKKLIEVDRFLTEVIDGKTSRRERLEMCTNIAALHNAMFQVMHEYLSEHDLESGGNTDCILLAKCFALFNMSVDEKQRLTTLLKPD